MYYLQSRYYDAEVGRFINSDSIVNTTDNLGFNTYAYCGNNPVNCVDSNGFVFDTALDIAFIAGDVASIISNPTNVMGYVEFAGDVAGGLGEAYKLYRGASRTLDYAGDTVDTFRHLDNAADVAKSSKKGWKVGDDINTLTKAGTEPKWSTARQRYWKNEALNDSSSYFALHPDNKIRMQNGKAPLVKNPDNGRFYSYELHHKDPVRNGGKHTYDNLKLLTPWDHDIEDKFRHFVP